MKLPLPCLRHARIVFGAVVLLLGVTPALRAQALDPAYTPNPNAEVFALAVQPDGKILVGGNFTNIAGVPRSWLARLNPDGTLDAAFDPQASLSVNAIAVQPDGKIVVGGDFSRIAGATRARIARLNADGTLDPTFTAGFDSTIHSLALQSDGRILVGGRFAQAASAPRSGLARLDARWITRCHLQSHGQRLNLSPLHHGRKRARRAAGWPDSRGWKFYLGGWPAAQ